MRPEYILNSKEKAAISALQKIAKNWPDSLIVYGGASQGLVVVPYSDYMEGILTQRRSWGVDIPNDGGDPDWEIE